MTEFGQCALPAQRPGSAHEQRNARTRRGYGRATSRIGANETHQWLIHVAASLGVADLLKNSPRSASEIADATGANCGAMYRLLHALASAGVLERSDAQFLLTDLPAAMRMSLNQCLWTRTIRRFAHSLGRADQRSGRQAASSLSSGY